MLDFNDDDIGELGRQLFCRIVKATASEGTFE